ncbi:hypothetical protein [Amycolatopsis jejuensis]|uniref:hypothetical protein n=1 Tax=Amycolatopsis jejuensis TaxID=330084 RepID=UPI000691D19B|nr:hypothetical protein [Amycolatopsis jejuensis]
MTAIPPTQDVPRAEMMKRVAFFADLVPIEDAFDDSVLPGCKRTALNILGFDAPEGAGEGTASPVGTASDGAAIQIFEGFNMAFLRCKPGNGTILHHHDTNETFMAISGTWRVHWNDEEDEYVDLNPLDTISLPASVSRRFYNLSNEDGDPEKESLLLGVIAGNGPRAFVRPEVLDAAKQTGRYTPASNWE